MRPSGRASDELRKIILEPGYSKHAEGSCMARFGDTHVLCTASLDSGVPPWLRNSGKGWVTAEYGMLPRSTHSRMGREAARGKQSGRTQEIQRLIGRSLRAVTNLGAMGERQIKVDCDVIQADGGTRTAAITGGFVALYQCFQGMMTEGLIEELPLSTEVAGISCGIYKGAPVLDLDYAEDSNAETDANFVMTGDGGIVEIQGTAEAGPFAESEFLELMRLARAGIEELVTLQRAALNSPGAIC
ncbi:MAG TPA: ribonuclease PH [Sneathiellales bacterium]|nr:ribonuclease PH [Sneathiellales bacterium]